MIQLEKTPNSSRFSQSAQIHRKGLGSVSANETAIIDQLSKSKISSLTLPINPPAT